MIKFIFKAIWTVIVFVVFVVVLIGGIIITFDEKWVGEFIEQTFNDFFEYWNMDYKIQEFRRD